MISVICKHSEEEFVEQKPYNEAFNKYFPTFMFLTDGYEPTLEEWAEAYERFFSMKPMYVTDKGILLALQIHLYTKLGYEKYGMPTLIRDEDREGILGVVEFWSSVDKNFKTREEFAKDFERASNEFIANENSRSIEDVLGIEDD